MHSQFEGKRMRHTILRDWQRQSLAIACTFVIAGSALAQDEAEDSARGTGNWPDPATSPAQILDIAQIQKSLMLDGANSRDRAVVVGDRGHILVSESRSEWRQVPAPTRSMLTAVDAVDNSLWAVGHDQVVITSTDGGLTWALQNSSTNSDGPLLDVLFLDSTRGFAVGAYGQFLSTSDAGATWKAELISDRVLDTSPVAASAPSSSEDLDSDLASTDVGEDEGDPHLNAIVRTASGLLIVGEAGAAYRSKDEGKTWTKADLPYEGSMFGAVALDNGVIVSFGLRGNAFSTANLGETWDRLESGTESTLLGGSAVPGGRAVIVGDGGTVMLLPANSNQLRRYAFPDGGVMSAVLPLSEIEFLTIGENGLAPYQPN